jgi:hypothetical protein
MLSGTGGFTYFFTEGLPKDASLKGFDYAFGIGVDKPFSCGHNIRFSPSITPYWVSSTSVLSAASLDLEETNKSGQFLANLGGKLIVGGKLTASFSTTVGRDFWGPSVSVVIQHSVLFGVDIVRKPGLTIPNLTIGFIH